jgi:hypothetical protein
VAKPIDQALTEIMAIADAYQKAEALADLAIETAGEGLASPATEILQQSIQVAASDSRYFAAGFD